MKKNSDVTPIESHSSFSFNNLGLSTRILEMIKSAGYTAPTPIQVAAIPPILEGKDLIGISQTGTGKTASFALPSLCRLETGRSRTRIPRILILEPTRELAAQVKENFLKYTPDSKLSISLIIGGTSFDDQKKEFERTATILIATPGRLLDHFQKGNLLLSGIEIFVIDEADRMLDMGFIGDIDHICKFLPRSRQTLFFSATMSEEINNLTKKFLCEPICIKIEQSEKASPCVEQNFVQVKNQAWEKRKMLRSLLEAERDTIQNAIIFCNRKSVVSYLCSSLLRHNFNAGSLHGDMQQSLRNSTLQKFRDSEIKFLVASDIAARGLDIPDVSHVFNYDMPNHAEDYIHRIGRTGRAGKSGKSFTLITEKDTDAIEEIKKLTNTKIPEINKNSIELRAPTQPQKKEKTTKRNKDNKNKCLHRTHNKQNEITKIIEPEIGFNNNTPAFMMISVKL